MSFRTYHEVTGDDRSRLGAQVGEQRARVAKRLADVRRVLVVMSGKGGVGKSWVTATLALSLARRALRVGVVDADLQSPTVARLLGAERAPLVVRDDGVVPAVGRRGVRVISTDLMLDEGAAFRFAPNVGESHVWRGAAEASVLRELVGDVCWGALDALIVDLPPDAARLIDLATIVPNIAGAIAVTIPTEESARSVARAIDAAGRASVPILGVVENMQGYACRKCGDVGPLFEGDAGARLSEHHGLPLLARLPFTTAPLDQVAHLLDPVADVVLGHARGTMESSAESAP